MRDAVRRLASPIQRFLAIEAASGVLLLLATIAALGLANSPWRESYAELWHTAIGFRIGPLAFERSIHFWVNDGLMTIFFFVVGLEIRREIHEGELSEWRRAALPLAAALGGMLVPAGIYSALNHGRAGAAGWGIPMATDIAFAVGALLLLGRRGPPALRVLLLALAVIDDIGAIVVIAIFYSTGVSLEGFAIAAAGLIAIAAIRAAGARAIAAYAVPAAAVWLGLYVAGVHPTLAGVAVGLLTPVRAWLGRDGVTDEVNARLGPASDGSTVDQIAALVRVSREAVSPAEYLQHRLHRWVAFGVMPLFAFANAGVELGGADLSGDGAMIFAGIVGGLVIGKTIGIFLACWLATRTGLAIRPRDVKHGGVLVVAAVAGIGFTMSLFVAQLAFPDGGPRLATAKLAILVGSACAVVLGIGLGRLLLRPAAAGADFVDERQAERSTLE